MNSKIESEMVEPHAHFPSKNATKSLICSFETA